MDRKLQTVDFVEQTMGVLSFIMAVQQVAYVVFQIITAPHMVDFSWIVEKFCLIVSAVLIGLFLSTTVKNFRPLLMAYGIFLIALSYVPQVYQSILGFTRVFGEPVFTSYSLFEFLYYCKHCFVFAAILAVSILMLRSRGLVNSKIETSCLILVLVSFIGQIYSVLYLLSNNVVLSTSYNCHIGYMVLCIMIPVVYVLYCCDESFGGVPTLS